MQEANADTYRNNPFANDIYFNGKLSTNPFDSDDDEGYIKKSTNPFDSESENDDSAASLCKDDKNKITHTNLNPFSDSSDEEKHDIFSEHAPQWKESYVGDSIHTLATDENIANNRSSSSKISSFFPLLNNTSERIVGSTDTSYIGIVSKDVEYTSTDLLTDCHSDENELTKKIAVSMNLVAHNNIGGYVCSLLDKDTSICENNDCCSKEKSFFSPYQSTRINPFCFESSDDAFVYGRPRVPPSLSNYAQSDVDIDNKERKKDGMLKEGAPDSQATDSQATDSQATDSQSTDPSAGTSIKITDDHFTSPRDAVEVSDVEKLAAMISAQKEAVLLQVAGEASHVEATELLIMLRARLHELQESEGKISTSNDPNIMSVLYHRLQRGTSRGKRYCEVCCGLIVSLLHDLWRCTDCGYSCHGKCLHAVVRMCARVKLNDSFQLNITLCPEKGLDAQHYKCSECYSPLSFIASSSVSEARLCEYSGLYFCNRCHWNDVFHIPARILHNWDFSAYKISRASKQLLKLSADKPILHLQKINPTLFSLVEELHQAKKLREEILVMKQYFLSCKDALESKILLQLTNRAHFLESADLYSISDLLDLSNDVLLSQLTHIHATFSNHIKVECNRCRAKGHICELCVGSTPTVSRDLCEKSDGVAENFPSNQKYVEEIIFPFDSHTVVCVRCSTVLHRHCLMKRGNSCPKCERVLQRKLKDAS